MVFAQKASAFAELNLFYFNDSLTNSTSASNNRTYIDVAAGFAIDSKKRYNIGWNYTTQTATDSSGAVTTKYSSTQMGPRFVWILDKDSTWSLGLGLLLISKAKFDDGAGNTPEWRGTAYKIDIGYNFPISESFFFGLRLNYSTATFNEQIVNSASLSNVSYSRSGIYPSLYTYYVF
jgi:hypothetical protein